MSLLVIENGYVALSPGLSRMFVIPVLMVSGNSSSAGQSLGQFWLFSPVSHFPFPHTGCVGPPPPPGDSVPPLGGVVGVWPHMLG
ncbi:MAG: hypothetical protein MUP55_04880 [Candidatus Aenigmarchaeota archaeon]|nr:hypothetical protein [Candidatus Aenigmarchaeota archaeon]